MKRHVSLLVLAALMAGCGAPVLAALTPVPRARAASDQGLRQAATQAGLDLFVKADANKDRYLSAGESPTTGLTAADFAAADVDRDGRLSRREFIAKYLNVAPWPQQLRRSAAKDMTRLDTDGNGRISIGEWRVAIAQMSDQEQIDSLAMFHLADKRKDQSLTLAEMEDLLAWFIVAMFQQQDPLSVLPSFLR